MNNKTLANKTGSATPIRKRCDQCELLRINGVVCHEIGCPNMGARWEDGEWVKYYECFECGCDVRKGEFCDCTA